ncbi:thioredoxin family protein [Mesomycoplasma flocculare]|uniref:thioredoxin family protein n=1 Tax=Mesomycoplasma flocculare TaxID=2128 RepID=UPI00136BB8F9|nr:thioredoxin family protein [Mesomycoplasma flocculare]MXR23133.1 thioredoxin [Mesomycoplasma flocculare]
MPIFDIHSTEDINLKIEKNEKVILVFHQPGCGACILYENTLEEINKKYGVEGLVIIRINVRENILYARDNLIQGTPTTLIYKDQKFARRLDGYITSEVLESHLRKLDLIN